MAEKKQKYYVVWSGPAPGIYESWDECRPLVIGVKTSRYKSYVTRAEAEAALAAGPPERNPRTKAKPKATSEAVTNPPDWRNDTVLPLPMEVQADAVAVDAACSGNPGDMEYRGVDLQTGQQLFHYGPVRGTNNIGEFLAIVHAMALLTRDSRPRTIYSDSRNAILWVKAKKCKTTLIHNAKTATVHERIVRAEAWLKANNYPSPLLKWDTARWGEIPADFGRK
jgi:ribonuclease HI